MCSTDLREAEYLLEAYDCCSDEDRADVILGMVRQIIEPYIKDRHPRALWLKSGMPNLGEHSSISYEEQEEMYIELLRESSDGGCAEAQYSYGCHLYENMMQEEALVLYESSAIQGFAPGQWCFGLDTLNGIGTTRDERVGMHYIRLSAEQQYDYAIEFMIRNCKEGNHGLQTEEAGKWEAILLRSEK